MNPRNELEYKRFYNQIVEIQSLAKQIVQTVGHDIPITEGDYFSWEDQKNGKSISKKG